MKSHVSRRGLFTTAMLGLTAKAQRNITGKIVDDSHLIGHKLRDGQLSPAPKQRIKVPVVIVGGGVAGLSAAWRLDKKGFHDFVVLELESSAGGNSRYGENEVSAYPWAAHYLPVPNKNAILVREICTEFGLLENGEWNERHLCHSPQERIFIHGRWQEGLEPELGVTREHRTQFRRFEELMREHAASNQFTIPVDSGAKPSPLDAISFDQWLSQNKFDSPYLRWYADYACRDDYGALATQTSAWAGIHYFAAREHEERGPLTWPEGNGWLIRKLMLQLQRYVKTDSIVSSIRKAAPTWIVRTPSTEYEARFVIFAAPTFLAKYVLETAPAESTQITYSPWITANITLDKLPRAAGPADLAWDNVIYQSPSLGYVVATHQNITTHLQSSVWTWYHALAYDTPASQRKLLLEKDWHYWREFILTDLERGHSDIRACVKNIDVMRLGHAMVRPVPGFMFSKTREALNRWGTTLLFANSDLSGLSIFEEAQYRGVRAADKVLSLQ